MVCHMDKSSLVDVLGSFASNAVTRKLHEKYQVMKYSNGMHIDMEIKFSLNFSCWKFYWGISCIFIGTSIGMHMYSGINFLNPVA